MKRKLKLILTIGVTAIFAGCDITTVDRSAVVPSAAYATLSAASSGINSMYRHVNEFDYYGQSTMISPEIMADNMDIATRNGRYEQEYVNAVGVFMNRWAGRYNAINECNFAIANLKPILGVPQAKIDQLLGDAYFNRALAYYELLRVYSYEPGKEVNGFNQGVILRTTPTNVVSDADFRARSTNVEGYQLMEADLLQAIALLPDPAGTTDPLTGANVFPYRASKMAARAQLARVYLNWGRYTDAAAQADLVLAYTNAPLTASGSYVASWQSSPNPESIFESEIRSSDWSSVDGANNSLCSICTIGIYNGSFYSVVGSAELMAAHEATDIRKSMYTNNSTTLNKNMSNKWKGEKGTFLENIPIIRRSEVLLIAAESKARSGNDPGATTNINTLRAARGLGATAFTGSALIDLIMNERRVELAFEGARYFDLKRLGKDITKSAASLTSPVAYTSFKVLQQIPTAEINLNNKLKQNPGY